MRTIHFRALSIGALAVLTLGGPSAAQTRSSGLLNALDVRQLVARAEPTDHARLVAHFAALESRYTDEVNRHNAMSQGFVNPSRNLGSGLKAHCDRLADINKQYAAIVRELAAHHGRLAAGTPSTAPSGGDAFEAGAGAPAPTDQELTALAASARTPAEHRALADYFETLSTRYNAEITRHTSMAQMPAGNPGRTLITGMAAHCDRLVKLSQNAAEVAERAAALHSELAGIPR